jgi:radical SAM superfamily enzyme YgiQ (UPF0313 family)
MKQKILLINPPLTKEEQAGSLEKIANFIPPLGLLYIATTLKKNNFDVKLIESIPLKYTKSEIIRDIKNFSPDVIGVTATILSFENCVDLCENIKKNFKIPIIIGGPQITSQPNLLLKHNCFDFAVLSEGENTIVEFLENYFNKKQSFKQINGLAYVENEQLIVTKARDFIKNLDNLPLLDWKLIPPLSQYSPNPAGYKRLPFGHLTTSRGCPFHCAYCDQSVWKHKFRAMTPERMIHDVQKLIKNFGVKEIKFYDDIFTLNKKRVFEFCQKILKSKIDLTWSCSTRVDCVDEKLLKIMKKAGCWQIDYGIESGNQKILDVMKKNITLQQSTKAIALTKNAGINTRAFFVIGIPGETLHTIQDTVNFAKKLQLDIVTFYSFMAYPGCELYEKLKKQNKIIHEDYNYYTSIINFEKTKLHYVPDGMTEKMIKTSIKKAYRQFYFSPSYIIRQIKNIQSMEDIKKRILGFKTLLGL